MSKRAILVVDLQNDYFPSGKLPLVGIEAAADNAARVIAAARASGDEIIHICRFRFQCGTGGVREINVLREGSPATFSVSIETEATFLLFQLGLVDRVIVLSMGASCSSATCPTLEGER